MNKSSTKKLVLMIVSIVYIVALLSFKLIPKYATGGGEFQWVPFKSCLILCKFSSPAYTIISYNNLNFLLLYDIL